MSETPVIQHLLFDYCWCCGARFSDAVPPGQAQKEVHHIIPRQAGGTDGPTVSLCDSHHTKAHKIALRLGAKKPKPYFELVAGETDDCKQKLLWLATRIANAFAATKNDPNKKVSVVLTIDRQEQQILDQLKRAYPSLKSREAIVRYALRALYAKTFSK